MLSISGQWISPIVSGDCPPPCDDFTLTSLTDDTFIMFSGETPDGETNAVYIGNCIQYKVVSISNWPFLYRYGCG